MNVTDKTCPAFVILSTVTDYLLPARKIDKKNRKGIQ